MRSRDWKLCGIVLTVIGPFLACSADEEGANGTSPDTGGSAGAASAEGGSGGTLGGRPAGTGGALGGEVGGAAGGAPADDGCGDPSRDGVIVYDDVEVDATWGCPVYTLTRPIFVRSSTEARSVLTILPGVTVRGVKGDLEAAKFPGALIVSRTGRIVAAGTPEAPIVFTSAQAVGERGPGDWGGLALLGRGPTNVPEHFDEFQNRAGEMYIEGLTPSELILYGAPLEIEPGSGGASSEAGAGGAGGASGEGGGGGLGGATGAEPTGPDLDWDCGTLSFVRIEYPGFEVAQNQELNGLTLAGCGRGTVVDHVQVHRSSDDGVEVFGGTVDLRHVVVSGSKDDGLDWDQGWTGRAQFLAVQMHDDTGLASDDQGDNAIEADGFADPERPLGSPSAPKLFNVTLIASRTAHRAVRLREGTGATLENALIVAHEDGAVDLIDVSDKATADRLASGALLLEHSLLSPWLTSAGQPDSLGTIYVESSWFSEGGGSTGNALIDDLAVLLPGAFDEVSPGWVPDVDSAAAEDAAVPFDPDLDDGFLDEGATYRGAFEPAGDDWTEGWTSYP